MAETAKRRSDRVLITLPVSISYRKASGKPLWENASTVTVSENGAAIATKGLLNPGQEILIRRIRESAPREAECKVIGRTGNQGELSIFSVTFLKKEVGFWDIYFPPIDANPEVAGRALLNCKTCGARKIVHLGPADLKAFGNDRQVSMPCDKCKKSTIWVEAQDETAEHVDLMPANADRLAPAPSSGGENRRRHRRVAAEVAVCIRQSGSEDDIAVTGDISHSGLCFISSRKHQTGSFIQVAVPYSPTAANIFVDARIMHVSAVPDESRYRHGVMYLGENEAKP